jgi:hypothetical protein
MSQDLESIRPPYHTLQVPGNRRVAAAVALMALGFAIFAVASKNGHVVGGLAAVVTLYGSVRLWRMGARVEREAVTIVGYLTSRRLPWSDIERFEVRPNGQWPYAGFLIRRSSSRPLLISALTAPPRPKSRLEDGRRRVQGAIDELNRLLEESRATTIRTTDEDIADSGR